MMDRPAAETQPVSGNHAASPEAPQSEPSLQVERDFGMLRMLLFVAIAAASEGLAFAIVRATLSRAPSDPTTERIQSLIDEANRLLKQLDEKKSA
jgi:hypothetical protein